MDITERLINIVPEKQIAVKYVLTQKQQVAHIIEQNFTLENVLPARPRNGAKKPGEEVIHPY